MALSATKLQIIFVRATKILKNLFTRLVKQEKRSGDAPFRFELECGEGVLRLNLQMPRYLLALLRGQVFRIRPDAHAP